MSNTLAAGGLLGVLNTTPWYLVISFGLACEVVAAGLLFLMNRDSSSISGIGCLGILLGCLGIVFALTGFTAIFIGFFGGA